MRGIIKTMNKTRCGFRGSVRAPALIFEHFANTGKMIPKGSPAARVGGAGMKKAVSLHRKRGAGPGGRCRKFNGSRGLIFSNDSASLFSRGIQARLCARKDQDVFVHP